MMNAFVLLMVVVIAGAWGMRGFLSSLLHMLCVIAAGAMALSVWEPIALWVLGQQGGQDGMALNLSWGVALGVPFMVFLVLLRIGMDLLVPGNADCDTAANFAGGGICGLVSGIITMGMVVLSVGFTRLPMEFMGYQPVQYDNNGSLVIKSELVLPVEKLTAEFYKSMSVGMFRPIGGETLARHRPMLAYDGALLRTNFEEGKSKHAIAPDGYELEKRYTLVPTDTSPAGLFKDAFESKTQTFTYMNGEAPSPASSQLEGFVVKFRAGAKERGGNVIIGASQVQLVVQTDPNDPNATMAVQPLAAIAQAGNRPDVIARWRWDAPSTFFQSVGGAADATMAFEFITPKGSTPVGLYVKGMRTNVVGKESTPVFTSAGDRDELIRAKGLFGKSAGKVDESRAVTMRIRSSGQSDETFVKKAAAIPYNITLQKDNVDKLTITTEGTRNLIDGGEVAKFFTADLTKGGFIERNLQVREFAGTDDTTLVQVVVDGTNTKYGFLTESMSEVDRDQPPVLIDSTGTMFAPVGYVYQTSEHTHIYFNPQEPVQSINALPVISKSRPDGKLTLIYRVNTTSTLRYFAVGGKAAARFEPGMKMQN